MIREMPSYKLTVRDFVLAFIESLTDGQALVKRTDGVEAMWVTEDGTVTVSDGWNHYVKQ